MSYTPNFEGCFMVLKDGAMFAICGEEHCALQTRNALACLQPAYTWTVEKAEDNGIRTLGI
jgi:hypothetical protein